MIRLSAIATIIVTLNLQPLGAHEFWLMPQNFTPEPGENLQIDIKVGQDFNGNTYGYSPRQFNSFEIWGQDARADVTGRIGDYPAVNQPAVAEGLNIVTHFSTSSLVNWEEWQPFADFINLHGMGWVAEAHRARGLPEAGFSEAFTRFAKTLIAVGDGAGQDRHTGMFYELVAGANPYTDDVSAGLPVQLIYMNAPAPDIQIDIFYVPEGGVLTRTKVVTDDQGRAVIPPTGPGDVMLNAVKMIEPFAQDADVGYVWHSLWASLTYEAQ